MVRSALKLDRITVNEKIFGGQPCIRGMRIPVSHIVKLVASGMAFDEILDDYPELKTEDIKEALEFAAFLTTERTLPLKMSSK